MFDRFRQFAVHPALAKSTAATASTTTNASMAAPTAQAARPFSRLPDRIPVPGFGRQPGAAAPAPMAVPAILAVEVAPVAPVVTMPTWPDVRVIRNYVTSGHARVRFTSAKTGKSRDFRIYGIRRANGLVDFNVEIERRNASNYAFGNHWCYVGCIFARSLDFRLSGSIEEEYRDEAAFFGRWWKAITEGRLLTCATVSCRESRAAEKKAAREAEKAAEAAAKWSASIAKAASNAGAPPSPKATAAIHTALKAVRGMDEDRATIRNSIGFSKSASYHGHALADLPSLTVEQAIVGRDLVKKYRKQIDSNLVAQALDEAEAA